MAYKQLKLWFDQELAFQLASKIEQTYPKFEKEVFVDKISEQIDQFELKGRVAYMAKCIHELMPFSYEENIKILLSILGPINKKETGMFKEYYWVMPLAKYVEDYGLQNFEISMLALEDITQRNTSEYAVRPYIKMYPEKAVNQLLQWSRHSNFHVRRLSCEGARPRLPWATKLDLFIKDPRPLLPILENLKNDPSKYVQNSVANCLNDILKDNLEIGKSVLTSWSLLPSSSTKWIVKHSLRNFRKKQVPWAMEIIAKL